MFLFLPNTGYIIKGFKFHAQPQTGAYSCYILKEASTKVLVTTLMKLYERTSSGISKNRSRFPNRPSWAELRRAQSCRIDFISSFSTEIGGTHYGRTINVGDLPDHKCVYLNWNCALGYEKKSERSRHRGSRRHLSTENSVLKRSPINKRYYCT